MELKTYFAQDAAGNIISSAIVNVFLQGTSTLATGLTRANGTPLENPFAADGAGRIQFRAPDGYYDVNVSAGSGLIQTLTIQCVDYSGAKADVDRAEAAADRADASADRADASGRTLQQVITEIQTAKVTESLINPINPRWTASDLLACTYNSGQASYFASAGSLAYVELIFASSSINNTTIYFDADLLTSGVEFICTGMDDLNRTNPLTVGLTVTHVGGGIEVNRASTGSNQKAFYGVSIRAPVSNVRFLLRSIEVVENGVTIARTCFDIIRPSSTWGSTQSVLTNGTNYKQTIGASGDSYFVSKGIIDIAPRGSGVIWNPPYTLEYYVNTLQPSYGGAYLGNTLVLQPGNYTRYRADTVFPIKQNTDIIAVGGKARIMAGVALDTRSWVSVQTGAVTVYKAAYNTDTNPDSAIRAGTKQPFIAASVPPGKTASVLTYAFTAAASVEEVRAAANRCYYDGTDVYFSFSNNDSCYVYVAEADAGIAFNDANSPFQVRALGIEVVAPKVRCWSLYPSSYAGWETSSSANSRYASLHSCGAIGAYSGPGFSLNNIDYELLDCYADSTKGDGMNFHYAGKGIVRGGYTRCSGDDGMSHHENCIAQVYDWKSLYNASAYAVPAYGALVEFYDCEAIPPTNGNSGKPYQNSWAVLAGQGSSAGALYSRCKNVGGMMDYSAVSQQPTCVAKLIVGSPVAPSGALRLLKSGLDADISVSLNYQNKTSS